jgi:hypothetical protein
MKRVITSMFFLLCLNLPCFAQEEIKVNPISLTDVQLGFGSQGGASATGSDPLVLFVEPAGKMPSIRAEIKYTGAGRLKGRWEVVRPGDPLPEPRDLLSEASLSAEEQRIHRF